MKRGVSYVMKGGVSYVMKGGVSYAMIFPNKHAAKILFIYEIYRKKIDKFHRIIKQDIFLAVI